MAIPDSNGLIHAGYQYPPPAHGANLAVFDSEAGGSPGGGKVEVTWPVRTPVTRVQQQRSFRLELGADPDYPDMLYGVASVWPVPAGYAFLTGTARVMVGHVAHQQGSSGAAHIPAFCSWDMFAKYSPIMYPNGVALSVHAAPPDFPYDVATVIWKIVLVPSSTIQVVNPARPSAPIFVGSLGWPGIPPDQIPFPLVGGQGPGGGPTGVPTVWTLGSVLPANGDNVDGTALTATDFPTPAYTVTDLPEWVTFTDNEDGTYTLSGNSPAGSEGVYPFIVTATNPVGSDSITQTILVS